ncbi:hypothetical protein ACFVZZ_14530 [Streptomyces chartreusis]|uniref:hypothetical protein n=1 Tax=Streptomyces chartreusis TaxID=1969 RepID=UPI0036D8B40F
MRAYQSPEAGVGLRRPGVIGWLPAAGAYVPAVSAGATPQRGSRSSPDLAKVDALTRPDAAVRRLIPAYAASGVWVAVCGVLVYVQIKVLKWAGTHHPAKDPDLAELAFYVCTVAVGVLVVEGVVRGVAGPVGRMRLMRTEITHTRLSNELPGHRCRSHGARLATGSSARILPAQTLGKKQQRVAHVLLSPDPSRAPDASLGRQMPVSTFRLSFFSGIFVSQLKHSELRPEPSRRLLAHPTQDEEIGMEKSNSRFDEAAVALLANMPAWRLRAIERIEMSSAFWAERRREIHVRPLTEVLNEKTKQSRELRAELFRLKSQKIKGDAEFIELIIPITELPKIALLDLKITVAELPVTRLSKDEGARIAAKHVIRLAREAGLMPREKEPDHLIDFLTFLFYHPSHPYEEKLRNHKRLSYPRYLAYFNYICNGESFTPGDSYTHFAAWWSESRLITQVAREYVIEDHASGSENPLISLPYCFRQIHRRETRRDSGRPSDAERRRLCCEDITSLLEYVREAICGAHNAGNPDTCARRFLATYFAYGYRWMAFVRCAVPLNDPFAITVEDKRAIYSHPERRLNRTAMASGGLVGRHTWHMVSLADAETNHVSVRVTDASVRLKHRNGWPRVLSEKLEQEEIELNFDEMEGTSELFLLQDSTESRPDRIYIDTPLRLTGVQSWMLNLTIGITLFAFFLLVWRVATDVGDVTGEGVTSGPSHGLTAKDVSLILVPVAFAASFLLVRDSSTLSMWIRQVRQYILMGALFSLLAAAFFLMWAHYIKNG